MILTCPNCSSRYLLSAHALAPEGRTVKCSECAQEWFETPDPHELMDEHAGDELADNGDVFLTEEHEDIPDAIKPFNEYLEEHEDADGKYDKPPVKSKSGGEVAGYLAALLVFAISFGVFLSAQPAISKAWPASAAVYEMFGITVDVPGQGLVFDRVKVEALNEESMMIEGSIINKTPDVEVLPSIEASVRDEKGQVLHSEIIEPPNSTMEPESKLSFRSVYQGSTDNADHVQLRFVLPQTKNVQEDDDSNPVLPQDDSAHPHGDEAP